MTKLNKRKRKRSGIDECEICGEKTKLVEHHIEGRKFSSCEKSWNKCWICPNCHDKIHSDEIKVLGWVKTPLPELIWEFKNSY